MNFKYKAVLFDLDGTLLNTLGDLHDIVNHTMNNYGFPELTIDEVRNNVGNGVTKLVELSLPDGAATPHFEEILDYTRKYYDGHPGTMTAPYQGIIELIDILAANQIKMAVVTNKIQSAASALTEQYFPKIKCVSGERESEGLKRKPHPDMVLWAADELRVAPEECIYVGDSEVDILTAHNSGMRCISVLWGFRNREFLETKNADVFVNNVGELLDYITL